MSRPFPFEGTEKHHWGFTVAGLCCLGLMAFGWIRILVTIWRKATE